MKKVIFCLALSGLILACSDNVGDLQTTKVPVSVVGNRKDELKAKFSTALASAIADSPELRTVLKQEALKMFDNDYDILYHMISTNKLSDGRTIREVLLSYTLKEEELQEIEREIPLLTIFVPSLPENSFSADSWDIETQIPVVAYNSSYTRDVTTVNGIGEQNVINSEYIPAFPVVVVKENERVVSKRNIETARIKSNDNSIGFDFLADCFNGSLKTANNARYMLATEIDKTLKDAYGIYKSADGWQRDYIYYGITPDDTNGQFSYDFQEHLTSFSLVGDPVDVYNKISDQTGDPTLKKGWVALNSGWTGGYYEFQVEVLFNSKTGLGLTHTTYFHATPDDLFSLTYKKLGFLRIYTVKITGLKSKRVNLPLFNWDLNSYSASIKVHIYEVDNSETITVTETRQTKFASNFEIKNDVLEKIGIKFGKSLEETSTVVNQRTYSLGSEDLGSVIVNFGDDVITSEYQSGLSGQLFNIREYSTGWYNLTMMPQRVQ